MNEKGTNSAPPPFREAKIRQQPSGVCGRGLGDCWNEPFELISSETIEKEVRNDQVKRVAGGFHFKRIRVNELDLVKI